jgi:hypothetical protein
MQCIADRRNARAERVKEALLQHLDQRDDGDACVVIAVVIAAKKAVARRLHTSPHRQLRSRTRAQVERASASQNGASDRQ